MDTVKDQADTTGLDDLVQQNIDTITRIEQASHNARTRGDVVADAIADFCGSTAFVWVHCIWFGGWLIWNIPGLFPKSVRFDPPPFSVLTLVVSLEAIFLSTFILISQNRQQRGAEKRNHLDLQINLLAEQETSQMLKMMRQIMDHLGLTPEGHEAEALREATDPERLVNQLDKAMEPARQDTPPN